MFFYYKFAMYDHGQLFLLLNRWIYLSKGQYILSSIWMTVQLLFLILPWGLVSLLFLWFIIIMHPTDDNIDCHLEQSLIILSLHWTSPNSQVMYYFGELPHTDYSSSLATSFCVAYCLLQLLNIIFIYFLATSSWCGL